MNALFDASQRAATLTVIREGHAAAKQRELDEASQKLEAALHRAVEYRRAGIDPTDTELEIRHLGARVFRLQSELAAAHNSAELRRVLSLTDEQRAEEQRQHDYNGADYYG